MVLALHLVLRWLHLIGFALLFGGFVAQYLNGKLRINAAMLWGSAIQLATGIALSAPLKDALRPDGKLDYAKIGVKLVLAILIAIMVWVPRKRETVARGHFLATGGLALLTAAVATFWR